MLHFLIELGKSGYKIYENINKDIIKDDPIDYLEFDVYKGDSIKKWLQINKNPEPRFFGFDSFEGLPEDFGCFTICFHFVIISGCCFIRSCILSTTPSSGQRAIRLESLLSVQRGFCE